MEITDHVKSKNIAVCIEPTHSDSNLVESADDTL